MRVWVDVTNSPHVLVFRPLIRLLRRRGAEVDVTAREFAQTLELLALHGIEPTVVGHHGGASTLGKARAMAERLPALRRFARGRGYDVALAHGSHDLTLTARGLGIPSATTFDYEFAWLQHQLGCRAATRVVVPEAIPLDRLTRYGAGPEKLRRYPGLKEDSTWPTSSPTRPSSTSSVSTANGSSSCSGHRPTCLSTTVRRTRSSPRRCVRSGAGTTSTPSCCRGSRGSATSCSASACRR